MLIDHSWFVTALLYTMKYTIAEDKCWFGSDRSLSQRKDKGGGDLPHPGCKASIKSSRCGSESRNGRIIFSRHFALTVQFSGLTSITYKRFCSCGANAEDRLIRMCHRHVLRYWRSPFFWPINLQLTQLCFTLAINCQDKRVSRHHGTSLPHFHPCKAKQLFCYYYTNIIIRKIIIKIFMQTNM